MYVAKNCFLLGLFFRTGWIFGQRAYAMTWIIHQEGWKILTHKLSALKFIPLVKIIAQWKTGFRVIPCIYVLKFFFYFTTSFFLCLLYILWLFFFLLIFIWFQSFWLEIKLLLYYKLAASVALSTSQVLRYIYLKVVKKKFENCIINHQTVSELTENWGLMWVMKSRPLHFIWTTLRYVLSSPCRNN